MSEDQKTRRQFLGYGLGAVAAGGLIASAGPVIARTATVPVAEGPFYPTHKQQDRDADLTRFDGRSERAKGELTHVAGVVMDEDGEPIGEALVDVWQCNAAGRYHHERDPAVAPLDPNFQGWAQIRTDGEGRYSFLTVKPGAYAVDGNWSRPPHIHFKVSKRGYHELITQMFFEGEELNATDQLYKAIPEADRASVTAKLAQMTLADGEEALHCGFDVVLKTV